MDGGNIQVVQLGAEGDMALRIIPDPYCETDKRAHMQWFSFRVAGVQGRKLRMQVTNAGEASYAPAWHGYEAAASYDSETWFRVPTAYDEAAGTLTITHDSPAHNVVHYAYFAPYPMSRHESLVARMQARPGVRLSVMGHTCEGRAMDLLQVGEEGAGKRKVWVIARQHPGETMAEFFMEGLLERLTDPHDAVARAVRAQCVVYAVPNMCPDGSARGHLRTNAAGVNLNRAWAHPDPATSPEVACTLAAMDATGVDLLVDVHGDEELPYCFVAGLNGIPAWDARLETLQHAFCTAFMRHSPDFQVTHGYPTDAPGKANLTLCSKQIGQRFGALSLTLEMPFKDTAGHPVPGVGWSPQRAAALGAAMLGAVHEVAPSLR